MNQPFVLYEGEEVKVTSINWVDGEIYHISFTDANGKFHTAFQSNKFQKEGRGSGVLHLDLKNRIVKGKE